MKDKFGHDRGACKSCNDCEEFVSQEASVRCRHCDCKPVSHEKLTLRVDLPSNNEESTQSRDSTEFCMITYIDRDYGCYNGSQCGFPGCHREVEFDINTGLEYPFCSLHAHSAAGLCPGSTFATANDGTESTQYLSECSLQADEMIVEDIEEDDMDCMIMPVITQLNTEIS